MVDKTFILKENNAAIRKKIKDSGIHVCICTEFDGSIWLDYSTAVNNGVHGIGYGGYEMTGEEHMALFLHEVRNPVWCRNVDEFIELILEFRNQYESKKDSETT